MFWLDAAYFPPLLADVSAGQRGGILKLGAAASIWLEAGRPALARVAGGLVAAMKDYPAATILAPRPDHRVRSAVTLGIVPVAVIASTFNPLRFTGPPYFKPD